jgi:hypothetical protein
MHMKTLQTLRRFILAVFFACHAWLVSADAAKTGDGALTPAAILLDMVHNNPGEAPFDTHYNDPNVLKRLGYTGKVYELFEAAQFGVDWSTVDQEIFPPHSPEREWVDKKAAELDRLYTATKQAGLEVYCHTDMVILPKRLVERRQLENRFGTIVDAETQTLLRALVRQMFARFPQLDGLVVRIGETYLQGAPHHVGKIEKKNDAQATIIPLMNLLREEVCVKLGKRLIFRSWLSFDTKADTYVAVSAGVEPHPNLFVVVKHCEGDFLRGNPFSKVLGLGRHQQIVEVQCQREYEGKGAYPNYIGHGVIEGFEEHHASPVKSVRELWANPLLRGVFTWSRGGGWQGPYLGNELWCDLNIFVMSRWARDPNRSEEEIFAEFCRDVLKLDTENSARFRRMCLLSADAVYRGKRSTKNDISPFWSRDEFIGVPPLPKDPEARVRVVREKDEAVAMWTEIVALANALQVSDAATADYIRVSARYGLYLYQIYQAGFHLAELVEKNEPSQLSRWIAEYDAAWSALRTLKADNPSCATLYRDVAFRERPGIGQFVDKLRAR